MTKKIILVRGHSGSGKSTTADLIEQLSQGKAMRIESDMFRTTVDGEYKFEGKEASEKCIKDCYDTVKLMLTKGKVPIVANTLLTYSRIQPYIDLVGEENVLVIRTTGDYENVHDVPKAIVRQQKESLTPYPGEVVGVNESTLKLAVMFIKCDESTHDLYTR